MKVLIDGFVTVACRAGYLAIASVVTPARLVVAARVASIKMVVTFMT
jgi:hypothetical protein